MSVLRAVLVVVLGVCLSTLLACSSSGDDDATGTPAPTALGSPTAAGDATSSYYILYRDAAGYIVAQDLATGDSIGHPVDFTNEVVVWAACSPDGGHMAFLRQYFDRTTRTLEVAGQSGSQEFELPATTQGFDWSPDGSRIVYTEFDGSTNMHKMSILDLATGETTELTSGEAIAGTPAWSPDGDVIAFDIGDILATSSEIYLIDPDGGEPQHIDITADGQWRDPAWAPDGRLLVAGLADGKQQLYLIPTTGGEPEAVTDSGDIFKGAPKYSPDGSEIAYTGSIILAQASAVAMKLHSFGIFLVNPDGSDERSLTADPRLNPGAQVDPYLDAYLLGWCVPGAWIDDSWGPVEAQPTPVPAQ